MTKGLVLMDYLWKRLSITIHTIIVVIGSSSNIMIKSCRSLPKAFSNSNLIVLTAIKL